MIVFSDKIYFKLTIGFIALPLITLCNEQSEKGIFFQDILVGHYLILYCTLLFWLLFIVNKIAKKDTRTFDFAVLLLIFGPIIGAVLGRVNVHSSGIFFIFVHIAITWPYCILKALSQKR